MKINLTEIFILIVMIIAIILFYRAIAQSNLPLWLKFFLLK